MRTIGHDAFNTRSLSSSDCRSLVVTACTLLECVPYSGARKLLNSPHGIRLLLLRLTLRLSLFRDLEVRTAPIYKHNTNDDGSPDIFPVPSEFLKQHVVHLMLLMERHCGA